MPNGTPETWPDTVRRVVDSNLELVPSRYHGDGEADRLRELFLRFAALPAGRHLWMSGIPGRQFLFNCHVAGWDPADPGAHFSFMFDQLMQGGGVGANYSHRFLRELPRIRSAVDFHLLCSPDHPDYSDTLRWLSQEYRHPWPAPDPVEDSREGWRGALAVLLNRFWAPVRGPLVLDLSRVRARGSTIHTFGGVAAGPEPLARLLVTIAHYLNARVGQRLTSSDAMIIDHWIAEAVAAGNVHRAARMAIKSWRDPDISTFVQAKTDIAQHWTTNLSVEIDHGFITGLERGDEQALNVYDQLVDGMLHNGEPGFWNISVASGGEAHEVIATNPCGEIALQPWENCNLGHVNLSAFPDDVDGALEAHRLMARFLLRATFADVPDSRQREILNRNRRIGVGHFGYQGWLIAQNKRFSDSHRDDDVRGALRRFSAAVRDSAREYARELRVPEPIKVTTVAPTGTVAKLPGATEGIQPIYARYYLRRIRLPATDPALASFGADGFEVSDDIYMADTKIVTVPTKDLLLDLAERRFGSERAHLLVESAEEIELEDFLAVQAMYQECYADNAVSATINLPPGKYTKDAVKRILKNYLGVLKGTTIMVDGSRPQAPFERISEQVYDSFSSRQIETALPACVGDVCPIGMSEI